LVTAILQSVGLLFYGLLLGLVPSQEHRLCAALSDSEGEEDASTPLLVPSPRLSLSQEPVSQLVDPSTG
jgi:hypothetical protein